MASPEGGPGGQPDQPVSFDDIVRGLGIDDPASAERMRRFRLGFNRFGADTAQQFADWQRDGIIRIVGAPLPDGPQRAAWDRSSYMGMFGAISYPSPGKGPFDSRYLLVLPAQDQADLLIVKPKISKATDPDLKRLEDDASLEKFDTAFRPGLAPFIVPGWHVSDAIRPRDAFITDIDRFGATVVDIPLGSSKIDALQEAVGYREHQIEANKHVTDTEMREIFGADDFDALSSMTVVDLDSLRRRPSSRPQPRRELDSEMLLFEQMLRDIPDDPE